VVGVDSGRLSSGTPEIGSIHKSTAEDIRRSYEFTRQRQHNVIASSLIHVHIPSPGGIHRLSLFTFSSALLSNIDFRFGLGVDILGRSLPLLCGPLVISLEH
jgi:hypothetical protein